MSTKYDYWVSNGGHGRLQVIDTYGNFRPSSVFGKTFFVDYRNGADTNDGLTNKSAFKTLSAAYDATESNRQDFIYVDGDSTVIETSMITWSKNRITVIGVGTHGRSIQQSAKIQLGVTTDANDLAPILVTGNRNSFIGLKVINANTKDESLYGFIDNGEGTYLENFMSVKSAGLDDSNHAHFWMAGDALTAINVTFGHSSIASSAACFGILIDAKSGGATTVKECFLRNVIINMSVTTGVVGTSCFIKIADTAAMDFGNAIDNLRAYHFIPSGQTILTNAIIAPSTIVAGSLFLTDPAFFGSTGVIDNPSAGIQIAHSGAAPDANGGLATNLSDA